MGVKYDFSGWATKNGLKCSDGRVIMQDAFKHDDGQTVPLVWNHQHNETSNVLGHALLENRDEGVYAYCSFNNSEAGKNAKLLVKHGDVKALSIYANQLKQHGSEVLHGAIREVSLVLAGANPGAFIDNVVLAHSDEIVEDEAIIYTGLPLFLSHAFKDEEEKIEDEDLEDEEEDSEEENEDSEEDPKSKKEKKICHSDKSGSSKTVKEVFDSLTEEQKTVVYAMIGQALNYAKGNDNKDSEGGKEMKHNVFDNDAMEQDELMHSALNAIISDGKRFGSLKESFLAHADEYGIKDIDWLFPDAKNITDKPGFIKRNPDAWVDVVMNGVHHTPFSRIKMMFADLREDDARAKGYATKGALKKEEVFGLLKRTVEPTTIYKKQKLDRDDIIDITDFDVVSWLKGEMRMMLDEEIARAIIFGDGRSSSSPDKIDGTKIIPVVSDAALYTIHQTCDGTAKEVIKACVRGQNNYEGSGNLVMFTTNSQVTEMLLIEDTNQHRLYKDISELALACSVNKIVKVPDSIMPANTYAVLVDLNDYNVGADKGGSVNMFDDFDIDYNQQKYLIETRCSGALTKPFSAIVVEKNTTQAAG